MHKIVKPFFIFILLILQAYIYGYSKNKSADYGSMPGWVNIPSSSYAVGKYFSTVGDGPDRQTAELKAVQGIASLFGQNVVSVATAKQQMEHSETGGESTNSRNQTVSQDIIQDVNQDDVVGVEIKEYWFDSKNNVWYVLAVLDKDKTASLYGTMIRKNNDLINGFVDRAGTAGAPMDTYACFASAETIAETNDVYLKRLSVVNSETGKALRAESLSVSELTAKMKEVAGMIPVLVDIQGDETGRIAAEFAEVIADEGFLTSSGKKERYELTGAIQFSATENSTGTIKYCRYTIDCAFRDTVSGATLIPYNKAGREGAGNQEEAKSRAVNALQKAVGSEFASVLSDYLHTQSQKDL
ncbi:MAG TPA: hypothetical protein DCL73_06335 [Treponema sp.]|nr:hypothetical protein [Treponema sp.]